MLVQASNVHWSMKKTLPSNLCQLNKCIHVQTVPKVAHIFVYYPLTIDL